MGTLSSIQKKIIANFGDKQIHKILHPPQPSSLHCKSTLKFSQNIRRFHILSDLLVWTGSIPSEYVYILNVFRWYMGDAWIWQHNKKVYGNIIKRSWNREYRILYVPIRINLKLARLHNIPFPILEFQWCSFLNLWYPQDNVVVWKAT